MNYGAHVGRHHVQTREIGQEEESMKNQWSEIDKEGLRKTLKQKDKVFVLTEMVSNAWDEDITAVDVSLPRLTCRGTWGGQ